MRDFEEIREEVYKCSKCGQCKSVCPVFIATKNEMYLPRGRYNVLNGCFNENKQISETFINNLDICLNCNECKRFCPSNIDSENIFTELKNLNNYKYSFLSFNAVFKILMNSFRLDSLIYRLFPLKSIFLNTIIDSFYDVKVKRNKNKTSQTKANVVYFQGCINKYINPSDKNASLNILEKLGYNVLKVSSNCCGLPYLSDGRIKDFEKNAKRIVKEIPKNTDYIVCSCDSCYETLKKTELNSKLLRLDELLKENNTTIQENDNILYHKPLNREDECFIQKYAKTINRKGACALSENFLLLKHPEIAGKLIENNFYEKELTDEKIIITTCNLARYGIKAGIWATRSSAKTYSLAEYINLSQ